MSSDLYEKLANYLRNCTATTVKFKETEGLAYRRENFWPDQISVANQYNGEVDTYVRQDVRIYKAGSWAIYILQDEVNLKDIKLTC